MAVDIACFRNLPGAVTVKGGRLVRDAQRDGQYLLIAIADGDTSRAAAYLAAGADVTVCERKNPFRSVPLVLLDAVSSGKMSPSAAIDLLRPMLAQPSCFYTQDEAGRSAVSACTVLPQATCGDIISLIAQAHTTIETGTSTHDYSSATNADIMQDNSAAQAPEAVDNEAAVLDQLPANPVQPAAVAMASPAPVEQQFTGLYHDASSESPDESRLQLPAENFMSPIPLRFEADTVVISPSTPNRSNTSTVFISTAVAAVLCLFVIWINTVSFPASSRSADVIEFSSVYSCGDSGVRVDELIHDAALVNISELSDMVFDSVSLADDDVESFEAVQLSVSDGEAVSRELAGSADQPLHCNDSESALLYTAAPEFAHNVDDVDLKVLRASEASTPEAFKATSPEQQIPTPLESATLDNFSSIDISISDITMNMTSDGALNQELTEPEPSQDKDALIVLLLFFTLVGTATALFLLVV